jgi:hypothetical protein
VPQRLSRRVPEITAVTVVLVGLLLIAGSQFTLFAMWFDMGRTRTYLR